MNGMDHNEIPLQLIRMSYMKQLAGGGALNDLDTRIGVSDVGTFGNQHVDNRHSGGIPDIAGAGFVTHAQYQNPGATHGTTAFTENSTGVHYDLARSCGDRGYRRLHQRRSGPASTQLPQQIVGMAGNTVSA